MCLTPIPLCSMPRSWRPNHRRRCPANLVYPPLSSHKELSVVGGLWNCRSAVQKADFITAYAKVRSALSWMNWTHS
ncbi:hypothetical protein SKAU_G00060990 [Synaphobranchus kaupii]|uniref:Uncharacterized protein n=1 Tax=Synaphobranchus kaupii TaxID=118154 RepID=A0A9Q1G613_SYNKA|nr:hypothetical protein SKAU_G00060990 [Synaphobranchus kaupii]